MQRKWAHLGRQHSSQGSKRTSNCLDEFHERSPYAVRQENYAGNPLNSYVGMNFTRDNAEIPAWMMCTEGHENGLPAEVRKSPRGGGIRDAKYFLFRLKNIYAQTQGFTLEPGFSVIIKQRDRPGGDGLIIELSSNPFYSANVTLIALNRHCAVAVKVISFAFPVHTKPSKLPTSEVIGPSFPP